MPTVSKLPGSLMSESGIAKIPEVSGERVNAFSSFMRFAALVSSLARNSFMLVG